MGFNIPEGYVLVPQQLVDEFIIQTKWEKLTYPTISETAAFLNVSVDKIKKDLRDITCPLRPGKFKEGGKGRGNEMRFFKASVKNYIEWLKQK